MWGDEWKENAGKESYVEVLNDTRTEWGKNLIYIYIYIYIYWRERERVGECKGEIKGHRKKIFMFLATEPSLYEARNFSSKSKHQIDR